MNKDKPVTATQENGSQTQERVTDSELHLIEEETRRRAAVETRSGGAEEVQTGSPHTWAHIQENWQALRSSLRDTWPRLTERELESIGGNHDRLVGVVQGRYGLESAEAERQVDAWAERVQS